MKTNYQSHRKLIPLSLVDQNNADLIFISEANLDELTPEYESLISGYNITFPKTVVRNGTARLVLLSKENLQFELRNDLMDDIVSSIWIKISRRGLKSILVCGIYREHQYLNQISDWSLHPNEQIRRWATFLRQVETARISSTCHIIGDCNLDYNKWLSPDYSQSQMVKSSSLGIWLRRSLKNWTAQPQKALDGRRDRSRFCDDCVRNVSEREFC